MCKGAMQKSANVDSHTTANWTLTKDEKIVIALPVVAFDGMPNNSLSGSSTSAIVGSGTMALTKLRDIAKVINYSDTEKGQTVMVERHRLHFFMSSESASVIGQEN